MSNDCIIIIPVYKSYFTKFENIAFTQCFNVLKQYPIVFIKPASIKLNIPACNFPFEIISFDDRYFKDIWGYNRLMLSGEFYGLFLKYKYMLIYQLDAFVFKDELEYWCNKDYDYIGAPWLYFTAYADLFQSFKSKFQMYLFRKFDISKRIFQYQKMLENQVGNGGFSLRKVEKLYDITRSFHSQINRYVNQKDPEFNEDVFWSFEVNRKGRYLNIPDYKKAVSFAFEHNPERAFELNGEKLPFGCHAWPSHVDFWSDKFKQLGYDIENVRE
jgi:hypothetical protein